MSETRKESRSTLADSLLGVGKRAFDPSADPASSEAAKEDFRGVIDGNSTWNLLPALNALIKPNVAPAWLQTEVMKILTEIPLRSDGVRGTLEFVFSVHPSSTTKESEAAAPQKSGANITQEALAVATRIITKPPSTVAPETWFSGIAQQLFHMLDGHEGQELAVAAAQVIMFGVLGKRQHGAPGSAGWNAFVEPILSKIKPSSRPLHPELDEVVEISTDKVLVTADALQLALRRLSVLINSTPYPAQTRRILSPVLPQIWAIASWSEVGSPCHERYCKQSLSLLQTFFKIAASPAKLLVIAQHLLCKGSLGEDALKWRFRAKSEDDIEIVAQSESANSQHDELNWQEVQQRSQTFVTLISSSCTPDETSSFFLDLLGRWLVSSADFAKAEMNVQTKFMGGDAPSDSDAHLKQLLEVNLLQKMLESIPERLISRIEQIVELVCRILDPETLDDQSDDVLTVALSLLNLVVTSPTFRRSNLKPRGLQVLETGLGRLASGNRAEVSSTARNLSMLLKYRDAADEYEGQEGFVPSDRQIEDRNTYKLAMSYITQPDSPPPVRSEGLNLISGLVVANSPVLDIQTILTLLSSLLQDNEDFINLRVIKIFTQLASKHPKATTKEILDHYLDAKETNSTDKRLRFGEALLQVIERLGHTFAGDVASQIVQTLLSIAGRRGYRPKSEAKQIRQARLAAKQQKQAEDAWEGNVPDLADEMTEEEQEKNEILTQIVEGWEGKRGSEDVRMRASALSILASGIETNISGVGADLVSASVDLCISVLTLEPDIEKGILRRAAVLLVLSFIKALDNAKEAGRRIGFGLTDQSREDIMRVLKYVVVTDNDGLVQQHARDVIESLDNMRMASMLPLQESQQAGPSIGGLAGLSLNQPSEPSFGGVQGARPRIEEVE